MGVCDWVKRISSQKRKKKTTPDSIASKDAQDAYLSENKLEFLIFIRQVNDCSMRTKEFAATQIQTAFRSYKARKTLRYLKRISRLQPLISVDALTNQASTALERLHFWSKIQAEIASRRLCISSEGRMKQMKFEDCLKVESKLHELEMKWLGGPETIEKNMLKLQEMEKATNKREQALAYAFSHQWRANSSRYFGQAYHDLSKESWGWNWKDQWIAVYRLKDHVVVRRVVSPHARLPKNKQQ